MYDERPVSREPRPDNSQRQASSEKPGFKRKEGRPYRKPGFAPRREGGYGYGSRVRGGKPGAPFPAREARLEYKPRGERPFTRTEPSTGSYGAGERARPYQGFKKQETYSSSSGKTYSPAGRQRYSIDERGTGGKPFSGNRTFEGRPAYPKTGRPEWKGKPYASTGRPSSPEGRPSFSAGKPEFKPRGERPFGKPYSPGGRPASSSGRNSFSPGRPEFKPRRNGSFSGRSSGVRKDKPFSRFTKAGGRSFGPPRG